VSRAPAGRACPTEPVPLANVARMLAADDVRRLAVGLPEAFEQDHHGRPSFRVNGKIFATLWTPAALNVMAGEELILAAVARSPDACTKFMWGRRLRAVQVDLRVAERDQVEELLHAAWRERAPRRLLAESS
jgi:hypothetical protein